MNKVKSDGRNYYYYGLKGSIEAGKQEHRDGLNILSADFELYLLMQLIQFFLRQIESPFGVTIPPSFYSGDYITRTCYFHNRSENSSGNGIKENNVC